MNKHIRRLLTVLAIIGVIVGAFFGYRVLLCDDGGTKKQAEQFQPMENWELVYSETVRKTPFKKDIVPETSLAYTDSNTNATRDNFAEFVDNLAGFELSKAESDPILSQFYYCATENLQPNDLECSAEFKKETDEGNFHYRLNVYFPDDKGSEVWVTISPTSHVGKIQGPGL